MEKTVHLYLQSSVFVEDILQDEISSIAFLWNENLTWPGSYQIFYSLNIVLLLSHTLTYYNQTILNLEYWPCI